MWIRRTLTPEAPNALEAQPLSFLDDYHTVVEVHALDLVVGG